MFIKLISKHRSELMAIALIWVAFYHSYFPIDSKLIAFALARCGYGGVSLFLFLSGFSMYYSYKKDSDYLSFVKKRFKKIVPFCIPLILLNMLIRHDLFFDACLNAFGINWLRGYNKVNWYTILILILYLVTPIYLKYFKNREVRLTCISLLFILFVSYIVKNENWVYGIANVCLYIIGIYFAYLNENDVKVNNILAIFCFLIGWTMMFLMYHYYRNDIQHVYPMILIAPSMLLILSFLMEKVRMVQKSLKYIGQFSYQFYLLHELVLTVLYNNYALLYRPNIQFDRLINVAGLVITLMLSIIYKNIIDSLINKRS
ncbi:MAG: acyltransferase [Solobacterium sp.]|nr:acyltransferase [Solobacterium sp.]MDD7776146.1 acyltransferase [Solobacterium sp.]MDY2953594.1 acyltransferase [Erysipelotrichaceae bacterium]